MTKPSGVSIAAERADRVRESVYDGAPPPQERGIILLSFLVLAAGIALVAWVAP